MKDLYDNVALVYYLSTVAHFRIFHYFLTSLYINITLSVSVFVIEKSVLYATLHERYINDQQRRHKYFV